MHKEVKEEESFMFSIKKTLSFFLGMPILFFILANFFVTLFIYYLMLNFIFHDTFLKVQQKFLLKNDFLKKKMKIL